MQQRISTLLFWAIELLQQKASGEAGPPDAPGGGRTKPMFSRCFLEFPRVFYNFLGFSMCSPGFGYVGMTPPQAP